MLDNFGSVEAIVAATSNEPQTLEEIGKNPAARINWTRSEKIGVYGFDKDDVGAVFPPGRKPYGLEATAINSVGPPSEIVVKNHSHQTLT